MAKIVEKLLSVSPGTHGIYLDFSYEKISYFHIFFKIKITEMCVYRCLGLTKTSRFFQNHFLHQIWLGNTYNIMFLI